MYYFLLFLLLSCSEEITQPTGDLLAKWQLSKIENFNDQGAIISTRESENWNYELTLEFIDNNNVKVTTCRNEFVGQFNQEETSLEVLNIGGTKVLEDEIGDLFLNYLATSKSYYINNDILTITSENANLVFILIE